MITVFDIKYVIHLSLSAIRNNTNMKEIILSPVQSNGKHKFSYTFNNPFSKLKSCRL